MGKGKGNMLESPSLPTDAGHMDTHGRKRVSHRKCSLCDEQLAARAGSGLGGQPEVGKRVQHVKGNAPPQDPIIKWGNKTSPCESALRISLTKGLNSIGIWIFFTILES